MYNLCFHSFKVREEGTRGLVKGWAPTTCGYSTQVSLYSANIFCGIGFQTNIFKANNLNLPQPNIQLTSLDKTHVKIFYVILRVFLGSVYMKSLKSIMRNFWEKRDLTCGVQDYI